ncbi:MAG: peptidoglycan DD-metalloendopeptidase family protein [Neisseria sp.]|nr:peptidoglycan DD-metalloendopeptidase family protein [Neisseria sp.]
MKFSRSALLGILLMSFSFSSQAAPNSNDLGQVRQAISAAQADLNKKQAAQKSTQKTLDKTRAALNKARQEVANVGKQQRETLARLQKLQTELEKLKGEITQAKTQISRLLSAYYKNRQANAIVLFLKNAETGQKARYLEYSRYINQANEKVIASLGKQQQELKQREAAVDQELAKLKKLRAQKQSAINKLGKEHAAAQTANQKLNQQIDQQTQKIARLRADETRLNQVLAEAARRRAEQQKRDAAHKQQAAQERLNQAKLGKPNPASKTQTAQANNSKTATTNERKPAAPRSTLTAEDRSLNAPYESSNSFSRLQGRLPRPVGGSITGRFGQAKPSGGTWRGVFFSTGAANVRSVAAGDVIHAGPVGGYGNTVIIDHGNGYTSIYMGLSSIHASGSVSAGSSIGTSGTLPSGEQGLYFEIRYRGGAVNPLSWLS